MTASAEASELEFRANIASLEALHHERRALLPEYARLRALHGPNGKWDARRKALLEACKIRARMNLEKEKMKVTEAAIDAFGHADDQYIAFVDQGIADATRYVELETQVKEIEERIESRNAELYFVGKEMGLAR